MTDVLSVENLHIWYDAEGGDPVHAVRGVTLSLGAGDRLGLVGESGSGKTTAMMGIAGLLPSSAAVGGSVRLLGDEILRTGAAGIGPHRWRDIAIVFQGAMNAFSPVQTIGSQLVEPLELLGLAKGSAATARVAEMLELVGVNPTAANRFPHELSGGMRQRAAIAMALVCGPKFLIADEPTTALDVMVQAQILELLRRLATDMSLTLVLISHDLAMVSEVCDRIAVMYGCQVIEDAPTRSVFDAPQHPYTRMLLTATPDIDDDVTPVSIPGAPPRLDQPIAGCSFAPRCPSRFEPCGELAPLLQFRTPSHVRCHLYAEPA